MPPKPADPKKEEEKKGPPPKAKEYVNEKEFKKAAKEAMKTVLEKPDVKGGAPAKDAPKGAAPVDKNAVAMSPE